MVTENLRVWIIMEEILLGDKQDRMWSRVIIAMRWNDEAHKKKLKKSPRELFYTELVIIFVFVSTLIVSAGGNANIKRFLMWKYSAFFDRTTSVTVDWHL